MAEVSVAFRTAMSHLARADEPDHPLNDCVADLYLAGVPPLRVHIANSAAGLTRPDLCRDLVRAGIALYGRTPVVRIDGRRCPGVGRVCMDQAVVDLGPGGGGAAEGDRAVLFGPGSRGEPTALDRARETGTIDYEILTGIRGRRVRRYVDGCPSMLGRKP